MRAVKCKNGCLSIINRDETALFNKIDLHGYLSISNLNEREHYIAEELFKRNVLKKSQRGEAVVYQIYPQQEKL